MTRRFYFAWVNEGEAFNPAVHNREDEDVFSHKFDHSEGDVAGLDIEVRNPKIGLLNPSRKKWAYYSYKKDDGTIIPLFYGRLLGVPNNMFQSVVTLQFTARPVDYAEQKQALAETMKVKPYWDPIVISPDRWDDPDTILEGYSCFFHIDPVTHVVTTSDVLIPEDGTVNFTEEKIFYDNVQATLGQPPVTKVRMEATIPWLQTHSSIVNIKVPFLQSAAASTDENYGRLLTSFTMGGLIQDWPKTGNQIGSGWTVALGELTDVSVTNVDPEDVPILYQQQNELPVLPRGSIFFPEKVNGTVYGGVDGAGFETDFELVVVALGYAVPFLQVRADASRDFGQRIVFELVADMQDIVTAPEDSEALLITINGNKVSDPTEDDTIPIGNLASRDFVGTPRGHDLIEHLICIARAHIRARARAVTVGFECQFEDILNLTLRKGVTIHDPRLPGGQASGKIIGLSHSMNEGQCFAAVTFGCSVGYGGSLEEDDGQALYIDDAYIDPSYFVHENVIKLIDASDISYTVPVVEPQDDGVDFISGLTPTKIIKSLSVLNNAGAQETLIRAAQHDPQGYADQAAISAVLQNAPTQFSLELIDLKTGPHVWDVPVAVSSIVLPKQIDLEAASSG